ncbi:MAG: hypothetical protein WC381_05445 [Kiritimatiellia bacterium]|jgi:hypothetical protein
MKILYLACANVSSRFPREDYLCDMLFHGFRSLFGADVVDVARNDSMYSDNPPECRLKMYGKGFTIWNTLDPELPIDRKGIESKIKSRYFDLIIYSQATRSLPFINDVCSFYPKDRVLLFDGEDIPLIKPGLLRLGLPLFKRELRRHVAGVFPISFCVPKEKMCHKFPSKDKQVARTPTQAHVFTTEREYYVEYQRAYFGRTQKKAGWDCCRHYEIVMNRCVPYFKDIQYIPDLTMTRFPKSLVWEAMKLFECKNMEQTNYRELEQKIFDCCVRRCTTEAMAVYVLDTIPHQTINICPPLFVGRAAVPAAECLYSFRRLVYSLRVVIRNIFLSVRKQLSKIISGRSRNEKCSA